MSRSTSRRTRSTSKSSGDPTGRRQRGNLFNPALANLADFSDVFALSNLPYLAGQPDASHLLIISQESGQIINVDRTGNVSSRLTIVADPGSALSVPDMTMDRDGFLYVVNENGGGDAHHPQLWVYAHSDAPNQPPTAVTLENAVTAVPDNTSTASPVKLADIAVTDDGLGVNNLSIGGSDAGVFQIIGAGLYLKAGTPLSNASNPSYSIVISVDDPSGGSSPDASTPYQLQVSAAAGGAATLIISEVAPWASGNSTLGSDWFELTNIGTAAQNITGWKVDDDSNAFGSAIALNGITSIAPGESVIFLENASSKRDQFLALWFGASPPPNLQVGFYSGSGIGLGTGGDALNLFDSTGAKRAGVTFGTSTTTSPLRSFDNAAGLNNSAVATLSATGVNGAFSIVDGAFTAIGSPGTIGPLTTPIVTISAIDAVASETGPNPATFRISRSGSTVGALTVNYTIATGAGQAVNGTDYTALTNAAVIATGESFVDVTVSPIDDGLFEGPEAVTVTLFDTGSYDVGAQSSATATIADNDAPDTTIDGSPAAATSSRFAQFTFSGSTPASAIARFECALDDAPFAPCSSPAAYPGLADGRHSFAVRAVSVSGPADPTPASVSWVVDSSGPVVAAAASLATLWPPNGSSVEDTISGLIRDGLSGVDPNSVTFRVIDDYGLIQPSGAVALETNGQFAFAVMLDASRLGSDRDGRRYRVIVTAADLAGNVASVSVFVSVPHDQGK